MTSQCVALLTTMSTVLVVTSALLNVHMFYPREMDCPNPGDHFLLHGFKIPLGVPDRAIKTAPTIISIRASTIAGVGAFAETFLKANTWLGEYEGVALTKYWREEQPDDTYMFRIFRRGYIHHYIDSMDTDTSSWIRYVNGAFYPYQQNVAYHQCYDKIFYRLTKDVAPGTELLVYYGRDYSKNLGVDVSLFENA